MKIRTVVATMVMFGMVGNLYAADAQSNGKVTVTVEGSGALSDLVGLPVSAVNGLVGAAQTLAGTPASISKDLTGTANHAIDTGAKFQNTVYSDIKTALTPPKLPTVKYTPGEFTPGSLTPPSYKPGKISVE